MRLEGARRGCNSKIADEHTSGADFWGIKNFANGYMTSN